MVSKYLAYNGRVSLICLNIKGLLINIENIQSYSILSKTILTKFLVASSLMGFSEIKEESDEIIIQLDGGGEAGLLYSIVNKENQDVIIKGFIDNKKIDESLSIKNCIGKDGNLIVIKNNKYTKLGYKGITPLISKNIVDNFKSYFEKSTQKPAFLGIEVLEDMAYGYLITFMPDCKDEDILNIKQNLDSFVLKDLINGNNSIDEISKIISGDNDIKKIEDNLDIKYRCDCSKEKYKDMLFTLKKSELEQFLTEEDGINIVCEYCNKSYDFSKKELEEIISKL